MRDKTILVTGGSGFIGSHLVNRLLRDGWAVVNLDVAAPKMSEHRRIWRCIDLRNPELVTNLILETKPAAIFNLAAVADIRADTANLEVNSVGVSNLLDGVLRSDTTPLFVHTSTQLVIRPGYDSRHPRDYAPYSDYGHTKATSEEILRTSSYGDWVILRPTNVWGPHHPTFAQSIWRYIRLGLYLHPIPDAVRSYGYVDNVVDQMVATLSIPRERILGATFYVGDWPMKSSVWIDAFSEALRGRPARRVPRSVLRLGATFGDMAGFAGLSAPIDSGRLYRMTTDYPVPMQPTADLLQMGLVSLREGVQRTVEWLKVEHRPQERVRRPS